MKKSVLLATAILAIGLSSNKLLAQAPPVPSPTPPTTPTPVPPPPTPPVPPTTPTPAPPVPPSPTPPVPPTPPTPPTPTPVPPTPPKPKRDTNATRHVYGTLLNVGGKTTLVDAFGNVDVNTAYFGSFTASVPTAARKPEDIIAKPAKRNVTL